MTRRLKNLLFSITEVQKNFTQNSLRIKIRSFQFLNIASIAISLLMALAFLVLSPILNRVYRRRIYLFDLSAIGHNVTEFIEFFRQVQSTQSPKKVRLLFQYSETNPTNNLFIFEIWHRRLIGFPNVRIVKIPTLLWNSLIFFSKVNKSADSWLVPFSANYSTVSSMTKTESFSLIRKEEQSHFEYLLKEHVGLKSNKFSILGIRDNNFYRDTSIRSTNLEYYIPSIQFLLDQGIPVVRMGRRVNAPIPIRHELFFDYAISDLVNDKNDILLFINTEFAIGDSYGLNTTIAAFGSPVLMATYPLDPRSFTSNSNIYFATQSLFTNNCLKLHLRDVVQLMNDGHNIGDERVLNALGLISVPNSPEEIKSSVSWFLDVAIKKNAGLIDETNREQHRFTRYLATHDLDKFKHYRKDALYSSSWQTMQSHIWPQSVRALIDS